MREILFRGKRVDNGEWVYGSYIPNGRLMGKDVEYIYSSDREFYDVIPETVGQYTGLKDKENKKIFEGDIVKYKTINPNAEHKFLNCKVYFYAGSGGNGYAIRKSYFFKRLGRNVVFNNKLKVIGNTHDNKELLK